MSYSSTHDAEIKVMHAVYMALLIAARVVVKFASRVNYVVSFEEIIRRRMDSKLQSSLISRTAESPSYAHLPVFLARI